jgi:2'-5' RNA ligase
MNTCFNLLVPMKQPVIVSITFLYLYKNMGQVALSRNLKEKLYFIAIIPPAPIYNEALEQKEYFKVHYNSKASLNSPPHLTLHMPFRWNEKNEEELEQQLEEFSRVNRSVTVRLDNFSSFPPRVIFINVVMSPELENLQKNLQRYCKKALNLFNANYKELPFHPHLTVAFRDLKKPNYELAWAEFKKKNFQAEFIADKVTLLKHNGRVWEIHREFTLQ